MDIHKLQQKQERARRLIEVVSIGGGIVSTGLIFSPALIPIGLMGLGGSITSFLVSSKTRHGDFEIMEDFAKHLEEDCSNKLLAKDKKLAKSEAKYQEIATQFEEFKATASKAIATIESLRVTIQSKESEQAELVKTTEFLTKELEKLQQLESSVIADTRQTVLESLVNWIEYLQELLKSKHQKFPELTQKFNLIAQKGNRLRDSYAREIEESSQSLNDLPVLITLIHDINVDFGQLKTEVLSAIRGVVIGKNRKLLSELQSRDVVPRSELDRLKGNFKARLEEFILLKNELVDGFNNQVEQVRQECSDDEFFEQLRQHIAQLENKVLAQDLEIKRLSQPHLFPGDIEQSRIGNELISRYARVGFLLDAIDWMETDTGYKLLFHLGRNRTYIQTEQLNANKASDFIKHFAGALNQPEFRRSERGGYIYLEIQKYHKQKSAGDINRLITSLEKLCGEIIDGLSQKPTIRIMGATGEGKGVVARYLLNSILTSNPWYCRLHDPQHGSEQDYWGIPKVSKSGDEMKAALGQIERQMIVRESDKNWSVVTLDVMDEIDTQLEQSQKKESFIDLISRIRHCGMKLILLGQNPKVGRAGFQWADMQQMTCIYMGASADDAIENNPLNRNVLNLKPTNLPVYVYRLRADIALVHEGLVYKLKLYHFSAMTIRANQPLRPGDVLSNDCCHYGNENIEIIPHMCKKKVLGGVEKELRDYYGCQINRMAISFFDDDSLGNSCGVGSCTVFIGLPASQNLEYWKKRIPDWDKRLECIGEVPSDLIY